MPHDRHRSKAPEERLYFSQLELVTQRLKVLRHGNYDYSAAVTELLGDAIDLCDYAMRWKRDDVNEALRLLTRVASLLTASEVKAKAERETPPTWTLREYAVLFATVSELYRRFTPDVSDSNRSHTHRPGEGVDRECDQRPS